MLKFENAQITQIIFEVFFSSNQNSKVFDSLYVIT